MNEKNEEHEELGDEEAYEDEYEVESDPKTESEDSKLSKITEDKAQHEKQSPPSLGSKMEDMSRDEDYVEDPSTSQYDAYYYYDDYESNNRSRYESAGKII